MHLSLGIGFSKKEDPAQAAQEAALQAKIRLDEGSAHFVLVFSTPAYCRPETAQILTRTFPTAKIIGSSTNRLLLSSSVENRGVAVLAISSKEIRFGVNGINDFRSGDALINIQSFAEGLLKDFGPERRVASLILSDGLMNETHLPLSTLKQTLGQVFPIVGGGSSDDLEFTKTYQYIYGEVFSGAVVGLLMGGQVSVAIANHHGWKAIGKPRFITGCEENIIHTIDGKKAVSLFEQFFEENFPSFIASRLSLPRISYPLGILIEPEKRYLLQNVIDVLDDGSLVCQGLVPPNAEVHVMVGNRHACQQAVYDAACEVKEALMGRQPNFILVFDSFSRQKMMGRSALQGIQVIKDILGTDIPLLGMSTYGEYAPLNCAGHVSQAFLQNHSITIVGVEQHRVY